MENALGGNSNGRRGRAAASCAGPLHEVFRRGLTGEPPAHVEPMRLALESTAQTTKAKTRLYAPEKRAWLSEKMQMLERGHTVYRSPQVTLASVAMALPKGDTHRMVVDYRVANDRAEKVPLPHTRLEEVQGFPREPPVVRQLASCKGTSRCRCTGILRRKWDSRGVVHAYAGDARRTKRDGTLSYHHGA